MSSLCLRGFPLGAPVSPQSKDMPYRWIGQRNLAVVSECVCEWVSESECVLALGLHKLVHSQGWVAAGRASGIITCAKSVVQITPLGRPLIKWASRKKRDCMFNHVSLYLMVSVLNSSEYMCKKWQMQLQSLSQFNQESTLLSDLSWCFIGTLDMALWLLQTIQKSR